MVYRRFLKFFGWGGKSSKADEKQKANLKVDRTKLQHWGGTPSEYTSDSGFERGVLRTAEAGASPGRSNVPQTLVYFPPPTSSDGSDSTMSTSVIPSVCRRPSSKNRDWSNDHKTPSEVSWDPGRAVVDEGDKFSDMKSTSSGYVSITRGRLPQERRNQGDTSAQRPPASGRTNAGDYGKFTRQPSGVGRTRSASPEQHSHRVYPIHESRSHLSEPEVIEPVIYEHEIWQDGETNPEMYHYIIPGGLNVIFWDKDGKEITRVGEFGDSVHQPRRVSPTIVQDEFGNELYRTGGFKRLKSNGALSRSASSRGTGQEKRAEIFPLSEMAISYASVPRDAKNIILIDDKGKEVPLRLEGRPMTSNFHDAREATPARHYWY